MISLMKERVAVLRVYEYDFDEMIRRGCSEMKCDEANKVMWAMRFT